jgi:hypothetical protein
VPWYVGAQTVRRLNILPIYSISKKKLAVKFVFV